MDTSNRCLADWAIRKIELDFKDDVCLLLEHKTLKLAQDQSETSFSFYIPATNRANGLGRTFIIGGIGYDLFPMSWERVERMSDVKEYNTTCLADSVILYARSEADRSRFLSLQARLRANLQNPKVMLDRAEAWVSTATEVFHEMLFAEKPHQVRVLAGIICDLTSLSVAFVNQRYFKHGQTNQIAELSAMPDVPDGFTGLYKRIVLAPAANEQKMLCGELISLAKAFVAAHAGAAPAKTTAPDFTELASWYQEMIYTWRRVYHWCDMAESINAYIWCCYLQREVDRVSEEFGIADTDMLSAYDPINLISFRARAATVEDRIVAAITAHGATIDAYPSIEEFLRKNI